MTGAQSLIISWPDTDWLNKSVFDRCSITNSHGAHTHLGHGTYVTRELLVSYVLKSTGGAKT